MAHTTALHTRMLIGFALGAGLGLLAHALAADSALLDGAVRLVAQPVGAVFLRLLLMLVIPLLFSALMLGISELGDLRSLGRVGLKTFAYTLTVSSISVLIGLAAVNLFHPGTAVDAAQRSALLAGAQDGVRTLTQAAPPASGMQALVNLIPDNPLRAAAAGEMLPVMVFALLFGIALALTPGTGATRLRELLQGLFDVSMRLMQMVLALAPYAVACLLFALTARMGLAVFVALGGYVAVVLGAMLLQQFGVYALLMRLLGGWRPLAFYRAVQTAMLTAFATASSNAALPTALRVAEQNLHLPPRIARFVLTVGATANQNGTALFEGVTVVFLAQVFGIELTLWQQATVFAVAVLGGIGTAGVPAGSIPVVAMILGMVGVPVEGIGLVLGVDRFLDMCRTTLNVTGDLVAATVVARGEPDIAPAQNP